MHVRTTEVPATMTQARFADGQIIGIPDGKSGLSDGTFQTLKAGFGAMTVASCRPVLPWWLAGAERKMIRPIQARAGHGPRCRSRRGQIPAGRLMSSMIRSPVFHVCGGSTGAMTSPANACPRSRTVRFPGPSISRCRVLHERKVCTGVLPWQYRPQGGRGSWHPASHTSGSACTSSPERYSFLRQAMSRNAPLIIRWKRSQMPLVCALLALVLE